MAIAGEINIVIADDNRQIRNGIRWILGWEADINIVGEAINGEEAIRLVKFYQPQIVLLDIEMPILDGLATAQVLKADYPKVKIIFLSSHNDRQFIKMVREAESAEYIVKDQAPNSLIPTIRSLVGPKHPFLQLDNQVSLGF